MDFIEVNNLISKNTMIDRKTTLPYTNSHADPYRSITINILTNDRYKMKVRMPTLNKNKQYKGIVVNYCFKKQKGLCCPGNFKRICLKHLILFILQFPIRILNLENPTQQLQKTYELLQNYSNHPQLADLNLQQQKVSIEKLFTEIQINTLYELKLCFEIFQSENISIRQCKDIEEIISIVSWIEFINIINCSFHLKISVCEKELNDGLIGILEIWSRITSTSKYSNELLLVNCHNQQVIKLIYLPTFGYNFQFYKSLSNNKFVECFFREFLIPKLGINTQYITVQFENIFPEVIKTIKLLFKIKHSGRYLLKIGNQIQVTPYNILLNSSGLSDRQFAEIINLLKLPGHYQFTCYSQNYFFNMVCDLFRQKPLIRFNYYQPIQSITEQRLEFIQKMSIFALQWKKKIISFISLSNYFSLLHDSNIALWDVFLRFFNQ